MTSQDNQATISDLVWPADGLEEVIACPVCGKTSRTVVYTDLTDRVFYCAPGVWTLYRCLSCESAYLNPRPTQETIGQAYSTYFTHEAPPATFGAPRIFLGRVRYALRNGYLNRRFNLALKPAYKIGYWLAQLLPGQRAEEDRLMRNLRRPSEHGRLLDVGSGMGGFLVRARDAGWDVQGLEVDPEAVKASSKAGIPVKLGTLMEAAFPDNSFDAITMGHVIEHLHDPLPVVKECYRILKPGGVLWIATPNIHAYGHTLFGKYWLGLDSPRHLVIYNRASLAKVVRDAGFVNLTQPRPNVQLANFFQGSTLIRQGIAPFTQTSHSLSIRQRGQLWLARIITFVRPVLVEELVLLARKPDYRTP